MLRRATLLTGLVALLVATPLARSAGDAGPIVRVRVEGKTTTIFGAAQPRARASTAMEALEVAATAGEFYVSVKETDFGPYVAQIGRYPGAGSGGWVFKVNGSSPPVGADKVELKAGDVVLWYWATFSDTGGPRTLGLTALRQSPDCYQAAAADDAGVVTDPGRVTFHVDGRKLTAPATKGCVGPHHGLVRATAPGLVRSNALP